MAIRLLDEGPAEQFRMWMNEDPQFRLVSREMTLTLALVVGAQRRLIEVHDGRILSINSADLSEKIADVTIEGTEEFWKKLLVAVPPPRFQNVYAGVRFGTCKVSGDSELYNAYYAALTRIDRRLCGNLKMSRFEATSGKYVYLDVQGD